VLLSNALLISSAILYFILIYRLRSLRHAVLIFRTQMKEKAIAVIFCLLFGVGFGAGGTFALAKMFGMLDTWRLTRGWVEVDATVVNADLKTHTGSDSTTYKVTARYRYRFDGRDYEGTHIGLDDQGSDNIGDWHRDHYRQLTRARDTRQPIRVWVDPGAPANAVVDRELRWPKVLFLIPFATLFPLISLGAWWMLWKTFTASRESASASVRHPANAIRITSNAKIGARGAWVFALFWNLIAFPMAALVLTHGFRWGIETVVLIFPLVGLGLLWWAIRFSLQNTRLGELTLTLDSQSPALGQSIAGTIAFEKSSPDLVYVVSLRCENADSRGDGVSVSTVWNKELRLRANGRALRFEFAPPTNLPPTEPDAPVHHRWRILIQPESGAFERSFDVVMAAANANASTSAVGQMRPTSSYAAASVAEPVAIPATLATITERTGTLTIVYAPNRSRSSGIALIVFGTIFGTVAWFLLRQELTARLIGAMFAACAFGLALGGSYCFYRPLSVTIDRNGARVVRSSIFGRKQENFAASDVKSLMPIVSYSTSSTNRQTDYYAIHALLKDGRRIALGGSIASSAVAEALIARIRAALGSDAIVVAPIETASTNASSTRTPLDQERAAYLKNWIRRGALAFGLITMAVFWLPSVFEMWSDRHAPAGTSEWNAPNQAPAPASRPRGGDSWFGAMDANDLPTLQALVRGGADVNAINARGSTALMLAASKGQTEIARWLIEAKANVNYTVAQTGHFQGRTPLINAAMTNHPAVVELLLDAGAHSEPMDHLGWPVAHYAAYGGCTDCLRALKQRGFNIDFAVPGNRGETPIMVAARMGQIETIRALIELGANPRAKDRQGENVYSWARFYTQPAAMELLEPYQ